MNTFCPFIKDNCTSRCVFRSGKAHDEAGETVCRLALAATSIDTYCDLKIREMQGNSPNPHHKK